jgi:hypothetical protein
MCVYIVLFGHLSPLFCICIYLTNVRVVGYAWCTCVIIYDMFIEICSHIKYVQTCVMPSYELIIVHRVGDRF